MLVPPDFAEIVADTPVELDRGCFVIAATLRDEPVSVDRQLDRLDALADDLAEPTLDGLTRLLFDEMGFQGNARDYYDPGNSYLDVVLDRRRGIPITLSVVCIEVGRRAGVPLAGIGMPGHFLVRDQVDRSLYIDPYRRGARLGETDCAELFGQIHRASDFDPSALEPVDNAQILTRILANLRQVFISRSDRRRLALVLRLLAGLPALERSMLDEAARVLTSIGQFDLAAAALERMASLDPGQAELHHTQAERLRARLN